MQPLNGVVFTDWDREQDFNYVLKTWLLGTADNYNRLTPSARHEFLLILEPKLKGLLRDSNTQVKCAYTDSDCVIILGFVVYNNHHLYFCHTKPKFRRKGLLKTLLGMVEHKPLFYIETNAATKNYRLVKALNLTFDPTIIFGEKPSDKNQKGLLC